MAKNLFEITAGQFELMLFKISTSQLLGIIKQIYEIKWDKNNSLTDFQVLDIERKETKVISELQRRKYLTKNDLEDYYQWIKKMNSKKANR